MLPSNQPTHPAKPKQALVNFDVFHVAAALHLQAAHFLRFDAHQLALARAAGLRSS